MTLIRINCIAILILAIFISGCDFSGLVTKQNAKYTIGFSQAMSDDLWRKTMNAEMERVVSIYPEMELIIRDGDTNNDKQIEDIEYFINKKVDVLIVSPNESEPLRPVIEKAYESGIPVILIDRRINSEKYTTYIAGDNYAIGEQAAIYSKQLLPEGGKILEVSGLKGSSPAQLRHEGFISEFGKNSGYTVIDGGDGGWIKSKTKQVVRDDFEHHGAFDLVFAHNDVSAVGVYEVAQEYGVADSTYFIGVDALSVTGGGVSKVMEGILTASLLYPTGAKEAIMTSHDILAGKEVPKSILLGTSIIDQDNAEIYMLQSEKMMEQQELIEDQQTVIDNQILRYENQRIYLLAMAIGLLLLVAFMFFLGRAYRTINIINKNLERKNKSISRQKNSILEMSERLKRYNEEKIEFFTFVSHEFRTPLAIILSVMHKIRNVKKTISQHQIKILDKNVKRLNLLVDQLMDFRQIENDKIDLVRSPCDLESFIPSLVQNFREIENKEIRFKISHEGSAVVMIDEDKLEKILTNLISNAIKFTEEDGKIAVQVLIKASELEIKVIDDGKGIPKKEFDNVFKPFFSSKDGASKYYSKGTGIGLNLVKKLVDLKGGDIRVESDEGSGTTFICILPVEVIYMEEDMNHSSIVSAGVKESISREEEIKNEPVNVINTEPNSVKKHKVLLVEDNPELNEELFELFSEHKYDVYTAFNGKEGIKKAEQVKPDIVITDLLMPDASGYEVASHIKKHNELGNVTVLILSALTGDDVKKKGYNAGVDDYLIKPFSPELLIAKVKNLLATRDKLKSHLENTETRWLSKKAKEYSDKEKDFITSLKEALEQNSFDPDFNVTALAEEMNMSRVSIYNKIKEVSELTPVEVIKVYRLSIAKSLIKETDLSISEVSYKVGFQSPSYFSKLFKEQFNISPKEFSLQNQDIAVI